MRHSIARFFVLGFFVLLAGAGCARETAPTTATPTTTTYLVTTANPETYCNGEAMDTDGYRQTITAAMSTTTPLSSDPAEYARSVALLATSGTCHDALADLTFSVQGDTVSIPALDGWAGISIALCRCKPEVEVNLLRLPGIKHVIWE